MQDSTRPLPHWTWDDLEAALEAFSPLGADDPVRAHLMRGLADDSETATPAELLLQVLSAGWVMAQVGAQSPDRESRPNPVPGAVGSAIGHRHAAGPSVS